jgi:recombination protein RecR
MSFCIEAFISGGIESNAQILALMPIFVVSLGKQLHIFTMSLALKDLTSLLARGASNGGAAARRTTPLDELISQLSKLPGLGPRSARRMALHLLKKRETALTSLIGALTQTSEQVQTCKLCGNYDTAETCHICVDASREAHLLCVVEDVDDLWALERSRAYKGRYHVLGGTLSALSGTGPDQLKIADLMTRVASDEVTEVILALGATVEGQTTAHYLAEKLSGLNVTITRPAQGMPMGGELDFLDDGTLITAFKARKSV